MSTILDALRKLEEDNRVRNADARTRLLSAPNRFDLRSPRRRRMPWTLSSGLVVAGIVLGVGLMFWRPTSQSAGKEEPKTEEIVADKIPMPPPQPLALPHEPSVSESSAPLPEKVKQETPITPNEFASPLPRVAEATPPGSPGFSLPLTPGGSTPPPSSLPKVVPELPQKTPPLLGAASQTSPGVQRELPGDFPVAANDVVQHSPFVTPASERSATPVPPPRERNTAAASKPAAPAPSSTRPVKPRVAVNPPPPSPTPKTEEETGSPPISASLNFLQWSPESDKRIAFIKIEGGPTTLVHEGDTIGGATVVEIRQDAVELRSGESRWTLRAR